MRAQRWLIVVCGLLALGSTSLQCCNFAVDFPAGGLKVSSGGFVVPPYLQLGNAPARGVAGELRLLWQTEDVDVEWAVAHRAGVEESWRAADAPTIAQGGDAGRCSRTGCIERS